jgi:hypothetical protein
MWCGKIDLKKHYPSFAVYLLLIFCVFHCLPSPLQLSVKLQMVNQILLTNSPQIFVRTHEKANATQQQCACSAAPATTNE